MISGWWLLVIIPASAAVGYMVCVLCVAARDGDGNPEGCCADGSLYTKEPDEEESND